MSGFYTDVIPSRDDIRAERFTDVIALSDDIRSETFSLEGCHRFKR